MKDSQIKLFTSYNNFFISRDLLKIHPVKNKDQFINRISMYVALFRRY